MTESIELLAPAGNEKTFFAAINHGASAVYLGLTDFSARKNAGNFSLDNFAYYVAYAHLFNVKVYVAVNTVIKNNELNKYFSLISSALSFGADAFIVQDLFLGRTLKKLFPGITLHLSTQAGVCNENGAKLAASYGFSRVILARETLDSEIEKICKIIETEVFVHGALCTCFSGHCYFSSFIGGNSGNRGACRQPCRKLYKYEGENISDNYRYALSLADLNLSKKIDKLKSLGVKSLKIEGRMRSEEYVCAACDFYSELLNGNFSGEKCENLKRTYNRGNYTEGLIFGQKSDLISDKVQNHLGSAVGTITRLSDRYLNATFDKYKPKEGDCYKIIESGKEIGNAVAVSSKNGRVGEEIKIAYRGKAAVGAKLNLTKDAALSERYSLCDKKTFSVKARLTAKIGQPLTLFVNDRSYVSDFIVQPAITCATTKSEIKDNLRKTDVYPFSIEPKVESDENCFVLKKALNELRSRAYRTYFYSFAANEITAKNKDKLCNFENFYDTHDFSDTTRESQKKLAIILNGYSAALKNAKINPTEIVYAPSDYLDFTARDEFVKKITADFENAEIYLYVPPYLTSADEEIISNFCAPFYGLYIESASSIYLAKRLKKQIFGGIELNVTNLITFESLKNENLLEISVSKELSYNELRDFNGFKLALGDVKIMSLIYCPFGKKCGDCNKKDSFYLIDGENRKFKVRRFKLSSCRFEIFNESRLKSKNRFNQEIFDFSASTDEEMSKMLADFFEKRKNIEDDNKNKNNAEIRKQKKKVEIKYTSGNLQSGVI